MSFTVLHDKLYQPRSEQGLLYRCLSQAASTGYLAATSLRNWAYDKGLLAAKTLPGRVISVGNLAVGGTGKTPVVISLARYLLSRGARPVIVTRGYKSQLGRKGHALLRAGELIYLQGAASLGLVDEARLMSHLLPEVPLLVGARRYEGALQYLNAEACPEPPTHWLLDDGFQHRRLARSLNIVLIAEDEPWGNGHLIPAGSLRERPTALRRADLILLTRSHGRREVKDEVVAAVGQAYQRTPILDVPFASVKPQLLRASSPATPSLLEPVLVVSGIARPQRLLADLKKQGVKIGEHLCVPDHHPIVAQDLLEKSAQWHALVTTPKDYFRDPSVFTDLGKPVFLADTTPVMPWPEIEPFLFDK